MNILENRSQVGPNPTLSAKHTSNVTAFAAYLDERNLSVKPYRRSGHLTSPPLNRETAHRRVGWESTSLPAWPTEFSGDWPTGAFPSVDRSS